MEMEKTSWSTCKACKGRGKISRRLRKKARLQYQVELQDFEKSGSQGKAPIRPSAPLITCIDCEGSGLTSSKVAPETDKKTFPHISIIGGGIGGTALAVACLHRGIPFTLYERDRSFDMRSQGYGLTLQQASKAIKGFGIFTLKDGISSTKHIVHTPNGKVIGEWGMRKWLKSNEVSSSKRHNVHIPRQSLRLALLDQLKGHKSLKWGHQFKAFHKKEDGSLELQFVVDGKDQHIKTDMLVGADGIRSKVRSLLIGEESSPLRYLDCIVILGICRFEHLKGLHHELLDSETVFQTANGNERIYMMPYSTEAVMWQLSFPMTEKEAKALSAQGPAALKAEACRRVPWHDPIPQILDATEEILISGYPVYDRKILQEEELRNFGPITLIGDAAHPMSPFKGQGANQALIDALSLARAIYKAYRPMAPWQVGNLREEVLLDFESKMLERTSIKVKDSAEAARFLHSDMVLEEVNKPRGRGTNNLGE